MWFYRSDVVRVVCWFRFFWQYWCFFREWGFGRFCVRSLRGYFNRFLVCVICRLVYRVFVKVFVVGDRGILFIFIIYGIWFGIFFIVGIQGRNEMMRMVNLSSFVWREWFYIILREKLIQNIIRQLKLESFEEERMARRGRN